MAVIKNTYFILNLMNLNNPTLKTSHPVDAVGVADRGDGFELAADGQDGAWHGAAAAAAGVPAALVVLVRGASRLHLQAGSLHRVVDAAGKLAVAPPAAVQHRDTERSAVFTVPARRVNDSILVCTNS